MFWLCIYQLPHAWPKILLLHSPLHDIRNDIWYREQIINFLNLTKVQICLLWYICSYQRLGKTCRPHLLHRKERKQIPPVLWRVGLPNELEGVTLQNTMDLTLTVGRKPCHTHSLNFHFTQFSPLSCFYCLRFKHPIQDLRSQKYANNTWASYVSCLTKIHQHEQVS